jgi:hypothetical protein
LSGTRLALTPRWGSNAYYQDVQALHDIYPRETGTDRRSSYDPAAHIAWVAETFASMPVDIATSMSTTQHVGPAELSTVRRLLPALAARYDLRARLENDNGTVTVWFDRPDHDC